MKRLSVLFLVLLSVLALVSCKKDGTNNLIELEEVSAWVSEKGYSEEDIKDRIVGRFNEDIIQSWGKPDFDISGFGSQFGHPGWLQIWYLDEYNNQRITLYLDENGYVEAIHIDTTQDK